VLEEARLTTSVRAMVLVSSAAYVDRQTRASNENEACDLYRASMESAEIARSAFNKSFFQKAKFAVASARIADAIGGGDWREGRMVPDLVRRLTAEEAFPPSEGKYRELDRK